MAWNSRSKPNKPFFEKVNFIKNPFFQKYCVKMKICVKMKSCVNMKICVKMKICLKNLIVWLPKFPGMRNKISWKDWILEFWAF